MDTGLAVGTVVDAGLYTLTVLSPEPSGACNVHTSVASHFTDTTKDWGLTSLAMGSQVAGDLDHDGYPDLILFSGNQDQREVIPTSTGGSFTTKPTAAAGTRTSP